MDTLPSQVPPYRNRGEARCPSITGLSLFTLNPLAAGLVFFRMLLQRRPGGKRPTRVSPISLTGSQQLTKLC